MSTTERILKELQLYIDQINSGVQYDYLQIAAGHENGVLELAMIGQPNQPVNDTTFTEDEFGDMRATALPIYPVEVQ